MSIHEHADAGDTITGAPIPLDAEYVPELQIDRYVVLDRLGSGSMGTVFLAYDPALDRKLAIKLHRPGAGERDQLRLQREAQAMARICHANVVIVHDVGYFGEELFVAMEYVGGGTLADWLAAPRSWRETLSMFEQTGQGLAAAHAAGLVHRDFKPANVLLDRWRQPKVADFGLVCASEVPDRQPRTALEQRVTRAGAMLGTPAYMAPEQFFGRQADARSDQFGFCVALHEALWGTAPFTGDDRQERRDNVVHDRRVPRTRSADVPDWLGPVVDRGLAFNPDERWPCMEALLAALTTEPRVHRRWFASVGNLLVRARRPYQLESHPLAVTDMLEPAGGR